MLMSANVYAAENIGLGKQFELKSGDSAILKNDGEIITFNFNGIWKSSSFQMSEDTSGAKSIPQNPVEYIADFTVSMGGQEFNIRPDRDNPAMFGPYALHLLSIKDITSEEMKDDPAQRVTRGSKGAYSGGEPDEMDIGVQLLQQNYLQGTGIFRIEKSEYTLEDLTKKFSSVNYTQGEIEVLFYPWVSSDEATTVFNSIGLDIRKGVDTGCTAEMPITGVINVKDISDEYVKTRDAVSAKDAEIQESTALEEGNCKDIEKDKAKTYSWATGSSYNSALVYVPIGQELNFAKKIFGKNGVLNVEPVLELNYEVRMQSENRASEPGTIDKPDDNINDANTVEVNLGFFTQIKAWLKNLFK